ncbi:MAG: hypothetical protein GY797_35540 [Deltaproteobacteria bacterium]|nr:hypothetical protein [Deltaproteobacteria bacterium]
MTKFFTYFFAINSLFLSLLACTLVDEVHTVDELRTLTNVDQIEVFGKNLNEDGEWAQYHIKTIDDPQQINLITEAFSAYPNNWEGVYPYLPGRLTVSFYESGKWKVAITIVGLFSENFSNGKISYFLSKEVPGIARPIEEIEFKELIGLLEVDEDSAIYDSEELP